MGRSQGQRGTVCPFRMLSWGQPRRGCPGVTGSAAAGPVVCPGDSCLDATVNLYGSWGSTWFRCFYLTKISWDFYTFFKAGNTCHRIFQLFKISLSHSSPQISASGCLSHPFLEYLSRDIRCLGCVCARPPCVC